jgi:predicted deacetylase
MGARSLPAVVSVHDVMPETLAHVLRILALLQHHRVMPVTLLVVPGRGWDGAGRATLRALQAEGYLLAGHGWRHEVSGISGLRHWLHSRFLSRNVAEHLALDRAGIAALIHRCYAWFGDHALDPPELYVPPAWAMGSLGRAGLRQLPFRHYEYLHGVFDAERDRFVPAPVLGYEADSLLRVTLLRWWNRLAQVSARRRDVVRIGIHPFDLDHRLANDLRAHLARGGFAWRGYRDLTEARSNPLGQHPLASRRVSPQ